MTQNGEQTETVEATEVTALEVARQYSIADFVPKHFRGKPANALIAVNMARRMKMDPYAVMKGLYDVHGTLGMTGSFAIALVNSTGKWGPIRYELERGEDYKITGCKAFARHLATGDVAEVFLPASTVKEEGWARNAKWRSMPEQMFRYRAAAFWARLYCPEALFGLHTVEEIEDSLPARELPGPGEEDNERASTLNEGLLDESEPQEPDSARSFDEAYPPEED